jgi:hypothetical protein
MALETTKTIEDKLKEIISDKKPLVINEKIVYNKENIEKDKRPYELSSSPSYGDMSDSG